MENAKLISVLKTLHKREIKKLSEFIASPYFNKNETLKTLYNTIIKFYPAFEGTKFKLENIYKEVFSGTKYDYHKISNAVSDLYQLVKVFLKTAATEKNWLLSDIYLLEELHNRDLTTAYAQTDKQIRKELEKIKVKDENYYFLKFKLERQTTTHYEKEKPQNNFAFVQSGFDSTLEYSMVALMKFYAKLLHSKHHGNFDYKMDMFTETWEYIKNADVEENLLLSLYKTMISLELTRSEEDYVKLMSIIASSEEYISDEDMMNILMYRNSFIAYRINKIGDESFNIERFKVMKEMIDRKFMTRDHILYLDYLFTFISAVVTGEYKWAEEFMNDFSEGISPQKEKSSSVNFCNAFINYYKKDFGKALQYLSLVNFKLFSLKAIVRNLAIRIYYEAGMHEQLLSAIDSFRHYLKNEKMILEGHKAAHYNFLKLVGGLAELKAESSKRKDRIKIGLLKKETVKMDSNALGMKNWLIKKFEEL